MRVVSRLDERRWKGERVTEDEVIIGLLRGWGRVLRAECLWQRDKRDVVRGSVVRRYTGEGFTRILGW